MTKKRVRSSPEKTEHTILAPPLKFQSVPASAPNTKSAVDRIAHQLRHASSFANGLVARLSSAPVLAWWGVAGSTINYSGLMKTYLLRARHMSRRHPPT